MPPRKRIHTTSTNQQGTSERVPYSVRKQLNNRREVAIEAARIMATEGQHNFMAAKRKAAEHVGINPRLALPSNREVEEALRAYQGFYGGEKHTIHLQQLRETAVDVMRRLEGFSPRLVGPVLDGTADTHSRVSLHLFNDPSEDVLFHLQEKGVKYQTEQRKIRWHDGNHKFIQLLVLDFAGTAVELALFGSVDLRQAPPSPVDGRPQKRAPLYEVECLLAAA